MLLLGSYFANPFSYTTFSLFFGLKSYMDVKAWGLNFIGDIKIPSNRKGLYLFERKCTGPKSFG